MKKSRVQIFDICAILAFSGMVFLYWETVSTKLDSVFIHLFGKSLTNRGLLFQTLTALLIVLLCAGLLALTHRFITGKHTDPRIRYAGILLLLAVPAAQFLTICVNQILRRDDYWEIADAYSYGFPGSILFELKNHDGRYFSWFLKSLCAIFGSIPYFNVLLAANIILLIFSCSLTAGTFLKFQSSPMSNFSRRGLAVLSGFIYAAMIILLASNIWEVWFWGAGTCIYGLSISLCILSFALVWRNSLKGEKVRTAKRILIMLVCFISCGGSELSTASLAAFLFILLIWKWMTDKKWDKWLLIYFAEVILIICGILLITKSVDTAKRFSEGNVSYTKGFFINLPAVIRTVILSLARYTFIDYRPLFLFLFIFFMLGMRLRFTSGTRIKFIAAAGLMVLTAHAVLAINVLLDYKPSRVVTIPMCWVYASMALLGISAGSLVPDKYPDRKDPGLAALCALLLVFCVNDFYTGNIDRVRTIRGSWFEREADLKNRFDSNDVIYTCSLPTLGSSHDDASEDPEDLYNIAMRMYYRVPAVIANRRCPPFDEDSDQSLDF